MRLEDIAPDYAMVPSGSAPPCPGCASAENALADGGLSIPGAGMPIDTRTIIMGAALFYLVWYAFTKK